MPLFGPSGGGGSGTVTSVDVAAPSPLSSSGGPVTASGTVTLAWAGSQTQNRVLASPSGSSGAVSLRALVAGDVPAVNPGALTGSGTVPLAALGGLTTTQLSATAGILGSQLDAAAGIASGQIAGLAASKITGANTLPDAVLSTNVPLLAGANTFTSGPQIVNPSVLATANYGSLSIGGGAWDGATAGHFAGSSSGTRLAINAASGAAGTLADWQVAGTSKFAVDVAGDTILGSGAYAGALLGTPTQTAPVVSSGGSLTGSTTYYYVVTALDPFGRETVQSGEQSATTTSSNKTIAVTWTAVAGAMGYRVYRSTTSGAYASASYYKVVAAVTKADTGAAADGTATPPTTTAAYAWRLDPTAATPSSLANTMTAAAAYGLLNVGSGPFDGTSGGKFAGSASGTHVAVNAASGYGGNLLDLQVAGASKFSINSAGTLTLAGNISQGSGLNTTVGTIIAAGTSLSLQQGNNQAGTAGIYVIRADAYPSPTVGMNASSGVQPWLIVAPSVKQSGSAGYTGLLVNANEGSTGSGTKLLLDLQVGATSKFSVDNGGNISLVGTTATSASAGTNGAVPGQVVGYLQVTIGGVAYKVPYYAA